ncbi:MULTISPECIES: response regulator [unclassified Shimia]|uniref:response regulator n=1 Tax=unclassified Shimia TaxID=2630038 RepID=UPI0031092549
MLPLTSFQAVTRFLGTRPYVSSVVAMAVVLVFAVIAEMQNRTIALQEQRTLAHSETSRLRAQIEGHIGANIQLVRGMVAALSSNLDMSQNEYSQTARLVVGDHPEFLNIAAAPNLVVTRVFPYVPNIAALGLDYNQNEAQRAAAFRVRDEEDMVLAGPVDLVQGGQGFIGRFPVWDTRNGTRVFWGIVSAVIDAKQLYQKTGLLDETLSLDIALVGKDGTGAQGSLFFGSPDIFADDPILVDVQLPSGTWQMATRPKEGWTAKPQNIWGTRLFYLLACVLILVPIISAGRLSNSRQDVIRTLRARETELERLSLVAKHASDSIVLSNADGKIIWVNAGFTRMTGYAAEEALGKSVGTLLNADETAPYTIEAIKSHQRRGQRFQTEILNKTKSGKLIWVDTNLFPVLDDDGKVELSIAIEREITQAKRYETELAEAKIAAEKADRAKSEFLANMSHEIRTPMNAIIGMSELLADSPLSKENSQSVATIRDSGNALLKIINDILDLSRLESGKLEISEVDFDLHRCVESVVDLLKHKAEQKKIHLSVEFDDDVPTDIRADDGRLRQILLNLIGNAIKFTSEGSVRILVQHDAASPYCITVKVCDTGIGISTEQAKHIFDRFSQADAATTRAFGGTGLGLTISTMLARRMGGDITLDADYTEGACFVATIQASAPYGDQAAQASQPQFDPSRLEGARVLLAEDNKTNRMLIRKYLDDYDLELTEVQNGLEAVEHCRLHTPDIVLMDMSMPELDGVTATRIIRSLSITQPPIIALTANAFESDKKTCLDAGMNYFLSKPINKTHLLQALSTHLEHRLAS